MRKWTSLIAVCLGAFMLLVDVTIVNVALPAMTGDLDASFSSLQWVIDIYALALAALLLGAGAVADRLGRRPVYLAGLVVFALASLAAGLAPSSAGLVVARGVQGVGAAAMFATTIALINASYSGRDRGVAFGVWGACNGAAAAAGPIIGGLLTEGLSWRWVFFVNLPVSVAAIALSLRALPRETSHHRAPIDVPGIGAFTVAAAAVVYALTRAPERGWGATSTLALLALAAVALVVFVVVEHRGSAPIIELALLRRPAFSGVLVASLLLSVAAFAYLAYTSLWLQTVRGMSPIEAGGALVPLSVASFVTALCVGRVLHTSSPRLLIGGGLGLIGVGALLQSHLDAGSSWTSLTAGLAVTGVGVGLATPTLASAALASVPPARGGMASGAVNTMRQLGYAVGIAGLGAIAQARIGHVLDGPGATARRVAGGQAQAVVAQAPAAHRDAVDAAIHAAFASGLNTATVVAGGVGLAGALIVAVTMRPARREAEPAAAGA